MIELALIVAASTLAAGLAGALALRLLPSVSARLAGLSLLAVGLPLAAVLLSGVAMFHMGADVVILAVAAASSTVAIAAALFVGRSITAPVDRLRAVSGALAGGDLSARAPEQGPTEIAELGAAFNGMAAQLEELFDARRELVAWASHDLRTPLAAIRAMIEAVEDGIATPDQYIEALAEQTRRLGSLVDDLFELARIDAGVLSLELTDASLGWLVDSCVRGLQAEAGRRNVRLETSLETPFATRLPTARSPSWSNLPATRCASASRTPAKESHPKRSGDCSTASGGPTRRARPAARASDSRSLADLSRPRAAGSGPKTARAVARGSLSPSPPPSG